MENDCITDMKGDRILPVYQIFELMKKDVCCKKCDILGHKSCMKGFMVFADEYKSTIKIEDYEQLFYSQVARLE